MKNYASVLFVFITVLLPRLAFAQINWTRHTVTDNFGGACSIHAQDINGDTLIDIIGAGIDCDRVALWINEGGNPISWTMQTVDTMFNGAAFVYAEDVDSDGDPDILACSWYGNELAWWENGGGSPIAWTKHSIATGFFNAHEITAIDMDGDNDIDVLGAAALTDEIAWFENDGLIPPGWTEHTISNSFDGARSVKAADIDGDGLLDVVGAALLENAVTWWRNNGNSTWTEHVLDNYFGMAHMVYALDIDADGDSDVVAAAYTANTIAWWRNDGGTPVQFTKQIIDGALAGALGVFAADINNDGHTDVLGTADYTDDVTWYSNSGTSPISWTRTIIDGGCDGAWPVYAADLDGDGDIDVLAAANASHDIYWYENDLIGINENGRVCFDAPQLGATIIRGPLRLPPGTNYRILDIAGRDVPPQEMASGIYFIQNEGVICQKIVKIK
ncbi:MAG: VCBS repeat-containing protein [candidate division WOR-3 bacterium]|nr:MAG: VCBS repeat-containing protein [candidate division WOR-3 bacterium]